MRELRLYIQLMGLSLVNETDKLHDMNHDLSKLSIQKVGFLDKRLQKYLLFQKLHLESLNHRVDGR